MTILRFFAMAAAVVILCAVGVLLTVLFTYFKWASELPDHTSLAQYAPPVTTRIHAGDGTLIAEYARERRLFVPIKGMPDTVTEAFTSAEDKSFFDHQGVDMRGVVRATLSNVSNYLNDRRLEGASTITQQVAKNFLLSSEKSIERKAKEWILATRIESALSKEQILELYLNEIYLGLSSYGVAAAALNYFDKSLNELTLGETAYLAALPKAPNNYHPIRRKDRAIARRNWVIERMYVNGFITDAEREAGQLEELVVKPRPLGIQREEAGYFAEEARRLVYDMYGDEALYNGGLSVRTTLEPRLQRIAIKVLREGLSAYDRRHGWRGAFATVDPNTITEETFGEILSQQDVPPDIAPWVPALVLDVTAEAATIGFADGTTKGVIPLSELAWAQQALPDDALGAEVSAAWDVLARGNVVFVEPVAGEDGRVVKGRFALRQIPKVNGAITVIDPHTGRVLAMVGGFSFEMSEFNRATQAARQPGSAFKPFVYAVALEQGMSPATLVLDAPFVIDQGSGQGLWKPDNYSDRFYGPSTLRTGIERSRNVMTVRLAQEIGMQNVVSFANRFGIKEDMLPVLSMALGAGETTLLRLTTAYGMLVNGGKEIEPVLIDRIQDQFGVTKFRADERACLSCMIGEDDNIAEALEPILVEDREQLIDERTAFQVVSMLEGVVTRGTATSIGKLGLPLAGKTGTTNEERDAWFVGFSPDLAVGVYVGFDTPIPMGDKETGGRVAAPIFSAFMQEALAGQPAVPFRTPSGMKQVWVNRLTGGPARSGEAYSILEAFKVGNEPVQRTATVIGGTEVTISGGDGQGGTTIELGSGTGGLY